MAISSIYKRILIFGGALGLSGTLMSCASTGAHSDSAPLSRKVEAEKLFEILDVNGDGKISKAEAKAGFQYLIASYDRAGSSGEILAAKPGASEMTGSKRRSKRKPTSQDATRAFETLFEQNNQATEVLTKEEFKKLVVKAGDNPESDPFATFF